MEETNSKRKEEPKDSPRLATTKEQLTIVNISKQIDYILSKENNKELERIQNDLKVYKQELEEAIDFKAPIKNQYFKQVLYSNVEQLLFEAIYIPRQKQRNVKIRQLFRWYNEKLKQFNSIDHIMIRTDKKIDEIFLKEELPRDEIVIQDEAYELKEFKKHRSEIEGFDPPKDRIKQFQFKSVNPPREMQKNSKVITDLRFNLERFKGRVGSGKSSISLQSTFYATKTGKKWFSNSGIGVKDNLQPLEPRKELKSSYSYIRPNYNYSQLKIEHQIEKEKNKALAHKRSQEEINDHIREFGRNRAQFKEEREMRSTYRNVVSSYDNALMSKTVPTLKAYLGKKEDIEVDSQCDQVDFKKKRKTVLYSQLQLNPSISHHRNKDVKEYKVYTSLRKDDLMKQLVKEQTDKAGAVQSDTLAMAMTHDSTFSARKFGAKICNVNEVDNPNTGYIHHYTPLSAFDAIHYAQYANRKFPQTQNYPPSTVAQFIAQNYGDYQYDLLSLRKTMDKFQRNEVEALEKSLTKPEVRRNLEGVKMLFEPIDHSPYSLSFLPKSKSSLLKIPPGLVSKKHKKSKKKK